MPHPLFLRHAERSHTNHELFCSGYLNVEEATVRGRLYDLPSGYPALVVPKENTQAMGTADPIRDASEQRRLRTAAPHRTGVYSPDGKLVSGELFAFDDLEERLLALDRLEGFDPGQPSLYRRVLIPVETSGHRCSGLGLRHRGVLRNLPTRRTVAVLSQREKAPPSRKGSLRVRVLFDDLLTDDASADFRATALLEGLSLLGLAANR